MLYRLENVAKSFGSKDVLVDATWPHDPGRVVGLVGRNGAGKTTVLRIVEGVLEPEAGRRLVAGTTTFASLEQAVEQGSEALRTFVAHAQAHLTEAERELRRLEEEITSRSRGGGSPELTAFLHDYDDLRERLIARDGGYEAEARLERV